jgi:hypothetical protein
MTHADVEVPATNHYDPRAVIQSVELPEHEKQELEALGDYVVVPLPNSTIEVRVLPQIKWRMSVMRLLNDGNLDGWAEAVIHPDDLDEFMDADLDMGEFSDFSEEAARRSGDSLGKSSKRSRSSRGTRTR